MMRYVLGFAFTANGRVALIQKQKPAWQAGRWNGIGGKIEEGESPVQAMAREFREETGVDIPTSRWRLAGKMTNGSSPVIYPEAKHPDSDEWIVHVFTTVRPEVMNVETKESETVRLWYLDAFTHPVNRSRVINNVPSLIELCKQVPEHGGIIPYFELNY